MALKSAKELECGICLQTYFEPRILPCGHSFCMTCLQEQVSNIYSPQNCATCRRTFYVPTGVAALPKNFSLMEIINVVNHIGPQTSTTCSMHSQQEAVSYCCTCNCFICQQCYERIHSSHNQTELQFVNNKFNDILSSASINATKYAANCQKKLSQLQDIMTTMTSEIENRQRTGIILARKCENAANWSLSEQSKFIKQLTTLNEPCITSVSKWIQSIKVNTSLKCILSTLKLSNINILSVFKGVVFAGNDSCKELQIFNRHMPTPEIKNFTLTKQFNDVAVAPDSHAVCASKKEVLFQPGDHKITGQLKSPYLVTVNKNGNIFISDFKSGVHEFDGKKNDWTNVIRINSDKQCWLAINLDNAIDEILLTRIFWVIEYVHTLKRFQLQEYSLSDGKVKSTTIRTQDENGSNIILGEYGYISYGCCRMTYDGNDTVFLKEYTSNGIVYVFSVSNKSCLCRLTIEGNVGLGLIKSIACDPQSGFLYIGQENGSIVECSVMPRKRYHELKVTLL